MRIALAASALLASVLLSAEAQVPHVLGTWKLDAEASRLPGPAPEMHVRRYSLAPDGETLIGLAVVVDAAGRPSFLQFAAKPDGGDYAEYDSGTLARLQIDGAPTPSTYSETPVDARTVEWADKYEGRVVASGRKWVSEDGQTLTFTADFERPGGERASFLFVFRRQPEPPTR